LASPDIATPGFVMRAVWCSINHRSKRSKEELLRADWWMIMPHYQSDFDNVPGREIALAGFLLAFKSF
jgi:hypothetical protein